MDYTYYDLVAVPSAGNIIVHLVDVQTLYIFIGVESESFKKLDYTTLIISKRLICISLVPYIYCRFTGFPMSNASWTGCGESGGLRDQLVSKILLFCVLFD